MKSDLKKCLSKIDEVSFIELNHALGIAKYSRDIMKKFDVTEKQFCDKLGVTKAVLKSILYGYYPFDMMMMAKLEAYQSELEFNKAEELHKKLISFPDYKDAVPVKYMAQFAEMISKELKNK